MGDTVTRSEWLQARRDLLEWEKTFTKERDALNAARQALPRVRVEKDYVFQSVNGPRSLPALFGTNSQLIIYHFMFAPDWDEGCPICSFWADGYDSTLVHLNARDISLAAVSRAPLQKLTAYKERMGWDFPWLSSSESDFNYDFAVSFRESEIDGGAKNYNFDTIHVGGGESPGISVFQRDSDGSIYHTYSAYARGLDIFNPAYHLMDIVPKGRGEDDLSPPMQWVRRYDQYADDNSGEGAAE